MSATRRVCAVTGSRADYGLLYWVIKGIEQTPELELQLVVTGMHLVPELGSTVREIEADGFAIAARVDMLQASDTPVGIATSIGRGVIGFAEVLERLQPELLLLIGDRYETLAAAQAATVGRIPIAHIGGGEVTAGVYDNAWRHALTKMAHLHFVTCDDAARRVKQLGEEPRRIFVVGNPGIDYIRRAQLLDRQEIERALGFELCRRNLLLTFHPATLDDTPPAEQLGELLGALEKLGPEIGLLFTKATADRGHRELSAMLDTWVAAHDNAGAWTSMGHTLYLSCMARADAVVGNSSSGLLEAPSFEKPAVNIGTRQNGRPRAESVIDCTPHAGDIHAAIERAFELDCSGVVNPYGDGQSAGRIVSLIRDLSAPDALLKKHFVDWPA